MYTKQIIFMSVSLFVGLFQFIIAKYIMKKNATTKRDITQNFFVKQWGRNSLVFAGIVIPFYYLKPDKILYIVLVFLGLIMYNASLLKKGIRRVNLYYPVSDPDGEAALLKKNNEINPK